ncbi:MAG: glycosyltransferase family 39 protein [Deltaproteobacteria bacterium]|nr:glycosyltransferase family 39 protein [Deltaproteobacteria bacterium]
MAGVRAALAVVALTVTIGLPRFAARTPDSYGYVQLARYLRGEVGREELVTPYAYRVLTPFIAAHLPWRDPSLSLALINVLCTIAAYLLFMRYLRRLLPSRAAVNLGMLIAVVSFPTFAYSSEVLTDPAGFLALIAASSLLLEERPYAFSATVSLGILARDSVVVMVAVFLLYQALRERRMRGPWPWITSLVVALPPLVTLLAVRRYFSDLPNVTGMPSLHQVWSNLRNPLRCASVLLTVGPPGLLLVAGWRQRGRAAFAVLPRRELGLLAALTAVGVLFGLYSVVAFVMSGRYVWLTYPGLIPLAVVAGRDTFVARRLTTAANTLFGP